MITVEKSIFVLKLLTALSCGLMAGVFFAFSTFVMKGLSALPANEAIAAMQLINAAVPRSLFGAAFIIMPIACLMTIIVAFLRWPDPGSGYLLAGGLVYLIGCLLITLIFNIPPNDTLAAVAPNDPNSAAVWRGFLNSWMFWNHVRTFGALASTTAFIVSLIR